MPMSQMPEHDNPLLDSTGLPPFAAIRPEHVETAVRRTLEAQRSALARAESAAAPGLAWLAGLERLHDAVARVFGPVSHLHAVASTAELREAYQNVLPLVTEFHSELGQNEALYRRFVELDRTLPAEARVERELVTQTLRDFRLGGVALPDEQKRRFREIRQRLAALQATFEQNVMDATDAFTHDEASESALAGLPAAVRERARAAAAEAGIEGFRLTLDPPT